LEQHLQKLQKELDSLRSQKAVAGKQLTGQLQRQHDDLVNLQLLTKEVEQAHATIQSLQAHLHNITQSNPDEQAVWIADYKFVMPCALHAVLCLCCMRVPRSQDSECGLQRDARLAGGINSFR
jgi:hypothetical protein